MLTPVDDYQFYQSGSESSSDKSNDKARPEKSNNAKNKGKRVSIDRRAAIDLHTIENMIETFDLNKKDMLQLVQRIVHHVNASEKERVEMAHKKAGDIIGIDDFETHTKQFIENWFGILTGARMHSKAVDIMDSFVLMFLPMTEAPVLPPGESSKSYCFNRPTSDVVDALVSKLQERGVNIFTQTRIINLHHKDGGKIEIDVEYSDNSNIAKNGGSHKNQALPEAFDAAVMALPHEVLWKIGLMPEVKKPFNDEWSFGTQYPLSEVPSEFKAFLGKSYNLCFDAPWNIVFQLQHKGGFWQDINFPAGFDYNLSATCSSPFNKGLLFGKRFMECTPDEAKEEILYQLGITDGEQRKAIAKDAFIDPINMLYTDDWQAQADVETTEMGILQDNGKRWVNLAQIYVRNAEDKLIETKTEWDNIALAGEIISVTGRWKIPTMEQAATSGKQAAQVIFDYLASKKLGDEQSKGGRQVSLETATLTNQGRYKYLDPMVTALSKTVNKLS